VLAPEQRPANVYEHQQMQEKAPLGPPGQRTAPGLQVQQQQPASQGKSMGFGFISFEKHDEARAALEALNGEEVHGQAIVVTWAQKQGEREEELSKSYEAQDIEALRTSLQGGDSLSDEVKDDGCVRDLLACRHR
jgi:hypothetical protein